MIMQFADAALGAKVTFRAHGVRELHDHGCVLATVSG